MINHGSSAAETGEDSDITTNEDGSRRLTSEDGEDDDKTVEDTDKTGDDNEKIGEDNHKTGDDNDKTGESNDKTGNNKDKSRRFSSGDG